MSDPASSNEGGVTDRIGEEACRPLPLIFDAHPPQVRIHQQQGANTTWTQHNMDPMNIIRGIPDEPTKFYTWTSYENPDFDEPLTLSVVGVQIDRYVIHMCNGTMCINPIDDPPISMSFDADMEELLINIPLLLDHPVRIVTFDQKTQRYTSEIDPPQAGNRWIS